MRKVYVMLLACLLAVVLCAGAAYAKKDGPVIQIVGGDGVPDGQNQWVAAIMDETVSNDPSVSTYCTGVLMDRNTVITAAHCLVHPNVPASDISVALGKSNLASDQGVVREIETKYVHPKYGDPCNHCHDVGVLNFSGDVPYDPITTGSDQLEVAGRAVRIAGYGSIDRQGNVYVNRMQEAGVPIWGDERAENAIGAGFVKPLMVGAGRPDADSCVGDSGGPLFDRIENGTIPKLIGITSFGAYPCAQADTPGVYTEMNAPSNLDFVTEKRLLNN
jgi:secreted trypsin-like serine protease